MRQILIGFILVFLAGCGSESFTEIEKDRAPLVAGLLSYASRDEVMPRLSGESEVKVVEDVTRNKTKSQPPYQVYAVKLTSYELLNQPGQLLVTFFNNRLMQVAFYPAKFNDYVAALRASGVDIKTGQELVTGHTTMWLGSDFDNIPYVGWADERLRKEQRRWLSKYS